MKNLYLGFGLWSQAFDAAKAQDDHKDLKAKSRDLRPKAKNAS
jgi:hypothetical protein